MENYKQTKRFENIVRLAVLFLTVLVCVAIFSFVKLGQARRENARYDELIASLKEENARVADYSQLLIICNVLISNPSVEENSTFCFKFR